MSRKLKVYFLHNLDGRNCGLMAARNKGEVRDLWRGNASEILETDDSGPWIEDRKFALENPGILFFRTSLTNDPWTERERHPFYQDKSAVTASADGIAPCAMKKAETKAIPAPERERTKRIVRYHHEVKYDPSEELWCVYRSNGSSPALVVRYKSEDFARDLAAKMNEFDRLEAEAKAAD